MMSSDNWRYIDEKIWTKDTGESFTYWILLDVKVRIFYYIIEENETQFACYPSSFLHDIEIIVAKAQNSPTVLRTPLQIISIKHFIDALAEAVNI